MKKTNRIFTVLIFIFLYIPMAVLILGSFNTGKNLAVFEGFTLKQYAELFRDEDLLALLGNSLLIAILSTAIATAFGTFAAVGIHSLKPKMRKAVMSLTNIPMTNPDIVTGISLSLLFVFIGTGMLGQKQSLNFWTLLIAHITFSLPYVILSVMPKLRQLDPNLTEAALDLGCTPMQAFLKVELPAILPGIISGMIMAFTLSLDDFVISYFTTGASFKTFPTYIYSLVKKPFKPNIYAISSIMTIAVLILLIISNIISAKGDASGKPAKDKKPRKKEKEAKR